MDLKASHVFDMIKKQVVFQMYCHHTAGCELCIKKQDGWRSISLEPSLANYHILNKVSYLVTYIQ